MTYYDSAVVKMAKKSMHASCDFSPEQCKNPKGECIVMWQNQRTTESYLSLTLFISVMLIMSFENIVHYFKTSNEILKAKNNSITTTNKIE